ncbi:uncharacterized protein [Euphorbia lathyris]|uniref:uncharacterized protein n=1 Tax=Euphorbia lathyris TaxID=212925 RepID=UPI003313F933
MADSEKLTALKKAYADIILNTAKEAAARIMVSESKAQRYQRELFAAKDESLRMLLRLKQMLDSKVNEAKISSLSQHRRIEELEAQLGEAEDIVKDLRAELRELQDELEKVTSRQKQPLGECNSEGQNATLANGTKDDRLGTSGSGSAISSLPALQCDPVINLETKNSDLNGACDGNKCHSENDSCKENCFACSPDFASIVMRSKKPELYRNGCTQRIRAFERLLGGTLSGQSDGVRNQENNDTCKQLTAKVDNFCDVEKLPDLVKDIEADNRTRKRRKINQCLSVQGAADMKNQIFIGEEVKHTCKNFAAKGHITSGVKRNPVIIKNGGGIPRRIRTKRASRYRRNRKYKDFAVFPLQAVDNNAQTQEDSRTSDNVLQKDPEPVVAPKSPPSANDVKAQSGCEEGTKIEEEFGRTPSFENAPSSDNKLSADELVPIEQDAVSGLSSKFPACKTDFEAACVSLSNSNSKEPDASEASPNQPVNNKFLKFTFQRKRKKELPNSPDGDSSLENNTRKMEGEVNGSLELHKSSLIPESSRDNRRLAQVARQLISLSEKKWR